MKTQDSQVKQVGTGKEAGGWLGGHQGSGNWHPGLGHVREAQSHQEETWPHPPSQALRIFGVSFQIEFTPEQIEGE